MASSEITMAALGCGTMGVAIVGGILASLTEIESMATPPANLPAQLPTRFIACVKRQESVTRVANALSAYSSRLSVVADQNVAAVSQADVILLGCKPWMVKEILSANGMREALAGKLLISILAGVTAEDISGLIYGDDVPADAVRVVRAMPNTASLIREGMTVIQTVTPPLPDAQQALVTWVFEQIGQVSHLAPSYMDVCTSLCGSSPAFFALVCEAAADGAVAMGLPCAEAQKMAAQAMRGAASLILQGEHPAVLRNKVSTPGGCTIGGLMVLEEAAVRGSVGRAVREATVVASQLGQGAKNVNGTRH
ncbi:Pyrroline-5-carboxylate reductase [Ceratocystis fimbriata CBS 114723]|uniref:Pyrroline-5-carboxylate reductase n=2 Tax=Ceratocystis TaxID=5157 RepID=A0A0F8DI63_CERFI|nr:Pyrroline-5-carboxylate reductase [Ceratocystis platani]PHH54668.1 Pyrroline-5-carboxylate reductase [Ceratocystis fimbriata CBS 114723]